MCLAVADYIIYKTNEYNKQNNSNIRMTCKRLMKLIYFCDAEYMRLQGEPKSIIKDEYYAWDSGPVLPDIYLKYVNFQNGKMFPLKDTYKNLDINITNTIDSILDRTFEFSTEKLIKISHRKNSPWEKYSNKNGRIPKEEIFNYYYKIK